MPARHLYFIMTNTWNRLALLIFAVLSLLVASELQAGVVVGGTRFIFPADRDSISISLTNTSQESWLINSKINRPTRWAGGEASTVPAPLLAAPPLILLKPGTTGTLRLLRTESDILPVDRETLFELSIASVPSGKVENQSVKVAMRSVFKLFWRPEGLPGDPLEAYQQLRWTRNSQGVQLTNPTSYYINLIQVNVNGKALSNAGVVPPKSQRQTSWCQAIAPCHVAWRAINDYGGLSAKKEQNLH
ncbi:fimbrial chaperone [Escherichia coli]|uniref:fimbrial chaperone n=1 Tax=Escherichia TaxID=561 RepID=UPI001560F7F0|nr:fimbrial chaperone [Escherichia coli]EFB4131423.1 fimbrial chaperone [Escherichia coli O8:H36]EFH1573743.1 fimbrial chaperone [Escherichia coli]EFK4231116.1 fimbrial chaperone [Escherichia coli]EFN1983902.1 fimbrial chaperone [Escherichia coli]EHK7239096.1 fimbrial chaperone [Escherichia coli]